jgi:formylglycine-generating enzyme required for sulfatase activity
VQAAERVQNARVFQQGNRVVVEYDLTGDKPVEVRVSLKAKGESFSADKLHLEGDFGKNVAPGKKRLVWNVLQDYPRGFSGEYVWDISAGGGAGNDPVTGMALVEIPAGCFQMGDTFGDGIAKEEKPVHEVCVDGFSIGKYEVKVGEFRKFVNATNYRTEAEKGDGCFALGSDGKWAKQSSVNWKNPGFSQTDKHPVVCVSWNDAAEFGEWLTKQSGRTFRLPTEAEWEYAARGGTSGRNYWGNGTDDACRYANVADRKFKQKFSGATIHECDDGYLYTAPAGSYKPNGFGLYDMIGNVWEWTGDWFGESYYGDSPRNNPQGPSSGALRVIRGGSWRSRPADVRTSSRRERTPGHRFSYLGFRLVSPVQ